MQASDIDNFKDSFKKYLAYFYIICMIIICLACLPFVTIYLLIKPDKGGTK